MKKRKTLILLFTTAILTLTPTSAFAAEAAVSQPTQVVTTAPAAPTPVPKKQGWETLKSDITKTASVLPVSRRLEKAIFISIPTEPC